MACYSSSQIRFKGAQSVILTIGHGQGREDKVLNQGRAGFEADTVPDESAVTLEKVRETGVREGIGHVVDTFEIKDDRLATLERRLDLLDAKAHGDVAIREEGRVEAQAHLDGRRHVFNY